MPGAAEGLRRSIGLPRSRCNRGKSPTGIPPVPPGGQALTGVPDQQRDCALPRAVALPHIPFGLRCFRTETGPGPVAQWSEPAAHNGLVAGSSPAGPTISRSTQVFTRAGAQAPEAIRGVRSGSTSTDMDPGVGAAPRVPPVRQSAMTERDRPFAALDGEGRRSGRRSSPRSAGCISSARRANLSRRRAATVGAAPDAGTADAVARWWKERGCGRGAADCLGADIVYAFQ